jgi:carboxymethylenebutenolidase
MNTIVLSRVCLLACALVGCAAPTQQPTQDEWTLQTPPAPKKEAPPEQKGSGSNTGVLSEDEFKALHQLRTDAPRELKGTMIQIGADKAYLSLPPNAKPPIAGIVVIHEWWGLNDHIKHWADRLAADGYAAVAVDLYSGTVATNPNEATAAMKAVEPDKAIKTMFAAHKFLAEDSRVLAKKRGCVGWCFGGGMSLKLALNAPDLDAAVMYYGAPVTDSKALASLHAPLLAIYGERDKAFPKELRESFDKALTEAGKDHRMLTYDALHAFANPSNPNYDEKSAAAAWEEVRKFFAEKLKAKK